MTFAINRRAVLTGAMGLSLVLVGAVSRSQNASAATVHDIAIKSFKYDPPLLDVSVGDKIRWTNHDIAPHTATAKDATWNTGELKRGESAVIEVTDAMSTAYFCEYHPHMRAALRLRS